MLKRIRIALLNRAYRTIAKLEVKLGYTELEVRRNRTTFASETMLMLNTGLIVQGMPRPARRRLQEAVAKGAL